MLFLVSDALSFRCRIKNGEYKSAHSFWRGGAEQSGITMECTSRVALLQVCVSSESDVFFQTESKPISWLRIRDVFVRYAQSIDFVGQMAFDYK